MQPTADVSPFHDEKIPYENESLEEFGQGIAIDVITPVSTDSETNKTEANTITGELPAVSYHGPEPQSAALSITAINSFLGTDTFKFPLGYGPTTLRLTACLVPLFREISYECKTFSTFSLSTQCRLPRLTVGSLQMVHQRRSLQ